LFDDKEIAFWVSAFFAIHPVQIAAVTYISGRAESLAALSMLLSFYLFISSFNGSTIKRGLWLCLSCLLYFLAVLSKELLIVSPILFILCAKILKKEKNFELKWFYFVAYGLAAILYFFIRIHVLGTVGQGVMGQANVEMDYEGRFLPALMEFSYYIRLIFLPYDLHMRYVPPAPTAGGMPLVMAGLLLMLFSIFLTWLSRNSKKILFGWVWFWLFILPILNIFFKLNSALAEHWLYNALIGFLTVSIGWFLSTQLPVYYIQKFKEAVLLVLLLIFVITTYRANVVWKDDIALYLNILKYTQTAPEIYTNLAQAYAKKGMTQEAAEYFKKADEVTRSYQGPKGPQ
jgi:hypothetical protein